MNLNDKLAKYRNSVANCQNIWQKKVSQLKWHISKMSTMNKGKSERKARC